MISKKLPKLARFIDINAEVKKAIESRKPLLALESTIITHGMPYPKNIETALEVENIVKEQGAVPATIGIIKGRLKIGLTQEEITFLASPKTTGEVVKTSRRDFPYILQNGLSGGTTVSGTMVAANLVGIKVFATGGVGGVHRDGQDTLDISADLTELGRTPVAVVCSGIKSILDIGRSLEYLETQGVCVATYGFSKDFPAFFCQKSGYKAPYNVSCPGEAAGLVHTIDELQLQSGILLAVPIPKEYQLMEDNEMENAIQQALKLAAENNIQGKDIIPFILQELLTLTKGCSLQSNIALIKNNALVGARISVALAHLYGESEQFNLKNCKIQGNTQENIGFTSATSSKLHPVVIGASILDSVVSVLEAFKVQARTLNGRIRQSGGGVGRNIADALGKLTVAPKFVSAIGDDQYGNFILNQTVNHLDHGGVLVSRELPTASYTALLDQRGELQLGVGDMEIHKLISPQHVSKYIHNASAVVFDGNLPFTSIAFILEHCLKNNIHAIFEPTDVAKATIPFQNDLWKSLYLITPNIKELQKIASFVGLNTRDRDDSLVTSLEEVAAMAIPLAEHINTVMVTLGELGVMMVGRLEPGSPVTARHYATTSLHSVVSVSGAGDCLAAGVISGLCRGLTEAQCVSLGLAAAHDSLQCHAAVPSSFSDNHGLIQYSLIPTA